MSQLVNNISEKSLVPTYEGTPIQRLKETASWLNDDMKQRLVRRQDLEWVISEVSILENKSKGACLMRGLLERWVQYVDGDPVNVHELAEETREILTLFRRV